jgi:hypothetical protein
MGRPWMTDFAVFCFGYIIVIKGKTSIYHNLERTFIGGLLFGEAPFVVSKKLFGRSAR